MAKGKAIKIRCIETGEGSNSYKEASRAVAIAA